MYGNYYANRQSSNPHTSILQYAFMNRIKPEDAKDKLETLFGDPTEDGSNVTSSSNSDSDTDSSTTSTNSTDADTTSADTSSSSTSSSTNDDDSDSGFDTYRPSRPPQPRHPQGGQPPRPYR